MPTHISPELALQASSSWWRNAVTYQVYPRSFAEDGNTGVGDLAGITSRLDYLQDLGIDAIWLGPFYPSPQVDAGYDVSDYCDVDDLFGDLDAFDELLESAHRRGIRVIIDLVPNHSSAQHPLFQRALGAPPGTPERDFYHFHDGQGPDGTQPPNNWQSVFGGPSWTRVTDQAGRPGQWYYHLFAAEQPDFNWENPAVFEFFEDVLRFWLDRGVDGFRIDVSDALIKDSTWPDTPDGQPVIPKGKESPVHEIYRRFRSILDEYQAMAVIETGADDNTVALFLRPDEMHQAFNFRFLKTGWDAGQIARAIEESVRAYQAVGAPTTWVTDNHDTVRSPTRYSSTSSLSGNYISRTQEDPSTISSVEQVGDDVGVQRARAMAVLLLSLPGSAYIYAGQELGLPEVFDLPDHVRTDPAFFRTNGEVLGRDGCRIPMPWKGNSPPFGFTAGKETWLPQPEDWAALTVESQEKNPQSMLCLYRHMLRLRREQPALGTGTMTWVSAPVDVGASGVLHLRFSKPADSDDTNSSAHAAEQPGAAGAIDLVVNFGSESCPLPLGLAQSEPLAASGPMSGECLPPNTAALFPTG